MDCEDSDRFDEKDVPIAFATIYDDEYRANGTSFNENSNSGDKVWDMMRYEARRETERKPLLVLFLFCCSLSHDRLESAMAFHLALRHTNRMYVNKNVY